MTIAQQVAAASSDLAQRAGRGDFLKLGSLLMKHRGAYAARQHAEVERASPRVRAILEKTAVAAGGLDSLSSIADYQNISAAWTQSLRSLSVYDRVMADGGVPGGMAIAPL
jgi:hypothetical protein